MLQVINGFATPEFKSVVNIFKNQLKLSGGGAALCVYHRGEMCVDVWGGEKNTAGDPWLKDTPVVSFSTTKGVLSTLLHIVMEEAQLDYETQVAHIWPSFKQENKQHITIRQLLCHESGLFNLEQNVDHYVDIFDWDQMVWRMAKAKPSMRHLGEPSYHAITFGWLIGELIRRLTGQKPGEFLNSELRSIMGRHNFIGVPERYLSQPAEIVTKLGQFKQRSKLKQIMHHHLNQRMLSLFLHPINTLAALKPPTFEELDFNSKQFLSADIPAMNGVFTARGLVKLFAKISQPQNGKENLLSADRLNSIQQVQSIGRDRIIHVPMHWRLGYHRILNIKRKAPFGFGHYGLGGSGVWCDPSRELVMASTLNTLWGAPFGDYRMAQLAGEVLATSDRLNKRQNGHHQPSD